MSSQFWDDRYRAEDYVYGRAPNDFVQAQAHRIPPGRVLCLAEGEGRNAVHLAGLGYEVTTIDFSAEGVKKTERLARERQVELRAVQADLASYVPQEGVYSGIIAIFAHLPPAVRRRVHGWVPRALQVGGAFILEAYTPNQLQFETGGPRDPELLMTLAGLTEELAPLTLEVGVEVERVIHEGLFHGGMSATVQLVGRRGGPHV